MYKTTIPIPTVHAYGHGEGLISGWPTGQAYLILDWVPGRSLDFKTLAASSEARREHFYSQLIDVLAELRKLQCTSAGSLLPNPHGGPNPVVGSLLSVPPDKFWASNAEMGGTLTPPPPSTLASTLDYALYQLRALSQSCKIPRSDLNRRTAEMELFATNHLQALIPMLFVDGEDGHMPFILTHPDLRCNNIMVDDELNIQSVIDWEWAGTTPQRLFMPPPWVTGQDLVYHVDEYDSRSAFEEFQRVLQQKASLSDAHVELAYDWDSHLPKILSLPLARMFQHHSSLARTYFRFIYPQFFSLPQDELVPRFFKDDKNRELAAEVQRRLDNSGRYNEYLKKRGLFTFNNQPEKIREFLRGVKELEEKRHQMRNGAGIGR